MGTGSLPGVKSGRGVKLTPHYLLVPWSIKSIAIPVLPLRAVRPVQRLSACTVQLYLYSPYGPYGLYSTAIPLLPLWAVRLVQNLSTCTRLHRPFFTFTSVVQIYCRGLSSRIYHESCRTQNWPIVAQFNVPSHYLH